MKNRRKWNFFHFVDLFPLGRFLKFLLFFSYSFPPHYIFSLERRNFCPKISQFLSFHRIFFFHSAKNFISQQYRWQRTSNGWWGCRWWEGIDIDDKEKIKLPENISRRPLCLLGCERWRNFVWMKKADDIQNGYYLV